MNLNGVAFCRPLNNFNNIPAYKTNLNYKYNLSKDTVSFSGKPRPSRTDVINGINEKNLLGEGLKGVVYKLETQQGTWATKVAKRKEDGFDKEAQVLKNVPSSIGCQEYVDHFKHPKTNCDVLVSTFVQGQPCAFQSSDDFNNLFNKLLQLDKAGVLHGDLNMQNCLFDDNHDIHLIDFGEGEIFNTGSTYDDFIYPDFVLKSNVVNLEHNGIPDCIQQWVSDDIDVKQTFKSYLSAKSAYYLDHADFLKTKNGISPDAIDYEENCAKVLENPSDEVVENEIRRIDCLYTFEQADTAVNYAYIPNGAKQNWKLAQNKAQVQLQFIDKTLEKPDLSPDERKYFENQRKIISMFYDKFTDWGNSTIDWLNGLANKQDLSEHEKKLMRNKNKSMPLPPDLVEIVV